MIRLHRALLTMTALLLTAQAPGAPIGSGGGTSPIAPTPSPVVVAPPVVAIGGPKQPILDAPAAGAALTTALVNFDWHADPTPPAPTRYQLCITLPGGSCTDANALLIRYLEDLYAATAPVVTNPNNPSGPTQPQFAPTQTPLTNSAFQLSLPTRFVGHRFEWSVAACGVDTTRAYIGTTPPERCNYTLPRTQGWSIAAPRLLAANTSVVAGFNPLKPSFGIVAPVPYITHYLFCISRPGLGCGTSPVSTADQLIVSTTATRFVPSSNLTQFQGRTMNWTAAACNVEFGCTYQQQVMQIAFPLPGPVPLPPALLSPAANERVDAAKREMVFTWQASAQADHYTLCVSPVGVTCGQAGSFEVTGLTGLSTSVHLPESLGGTGTTVNWTVAACNNVHTCRYQAAVRPLRIRAFAAETLDVLTYNIYMRPRVFNGQSIRAGLLPAHLHGHDVIIFNEAFDDDVRQLLLNGLVGEYPYFTSVVGTDRGVEQDGGVIIVSKWPILLEAGETFGECRINGVRGISTLQCNLAAQGIPDSPVFKQMCEGTDCAADKGVMYAKVCKNDHPYHVFGLHLQANHDPVHQTIQQNQLDVVHQMIDGLGIPASEPVFVGGDFNLRRDIGEGSWIESRLNATYPSRVTDLPWNCTYCFGINDLASDAAEGQVVLDYIVTSNAHRHPKDAELETLRPLTRQPWKEFFWESDHHDLSDHYPLRGRFTFDWPDDQGC